MIRPVDLPGLRAESLEMIEKEGPIVYRWGIAAGVQRIVPDLPTDEQKAALLAEHELLRVKQADLFYVGADMVDLAKMAARSMPWFSISAHDLPSPSGFVYFEDGFDSFTETSLDGKEELELRIVAASWGQWIGSRKPGLWITWYTDAGAYQPKLASRRSYRLAIHDECALTFDDETLPTDPNSGETLLWEERLPHSTASWAGVLRSIWLLMSQPVGTVSDAPFDRAARRRAAREGIENPAVRVINLRRRPGRTGTDGHADREFHHRWIVRGHWRMQPCGPQRAHVRPVWIAPHIKGPEDAPLLGGEKVYSFTR